MSDINLDVHKAQAALQEAAISVFAEMTFMDALVPPPEPGKPGLSPKPATGAAPEALAVNGGKSAEEEGVHAALDVLKPLSCRMEILLTRPLSDRIADILYGEAEVGFNGDEAPAPLPSNRNRDDSILEILNIMAGTFLSNYFGPGTPFKLELPFFVFGEADVTGPILSRVVLDVEGFPAEVLLRSIRYRY
jgi:hypothetical protein